MRTLLGSLFAAATLLAIAGTLGVIWALGHVGGGLPDHKRLLAYQPKIVTRIHAGDGRLLAEYAAERRIFVPITTVPKRLIHAVLSAEDKSFYTHPGLDAFGIARAIMTNLSNLSTDRRPVGASTITQQVAKNFLLSNEVSLIRKLKEAILAIRIEHALTKDTILELYLNEIFLGQRSYGVAAAALTYFGKSLDRLTLAEAAFLAALPKAPNNYHPERNYDAALARRNWVLGRMVEDGHISADEAAAAAAEPITLHRDDQADTVDAPYFAEEVRREIVRRYGEAALYEGGLSVRTTMDPGLQALATEGLRTALIAYDRRHGWRGPVGRLDGLADWQAALAATEPPAGTAPWQLAVVLEVGQGRADSAIGFADGARGVLPFSELTWARPWRDGQRVGRRPRRAGDVVRAGDLILVEEVASEAPGTYGLRQIPEVQGGLVAIDVHTGRVLAMRGGFSAETSVFNRATQAMRQPGSAFKPFVYLTALDEGFTPSSLVLDAPFAYDPGYGQPIWRPENYSHTFYGPTPLRVGIEKSRNVMTVRLAHSVGMDKVKATAEAFGIFDEMAPFLPMSLGAGETTVLRLTAAYAMLASGGKRIAPTLIDRVQDRTGRTIYRHVVRSCTACRQTSWSDALAVPELIDQRPQIADRRTAYQIVNIMTGVTTRGTAARLRSLGHTIAGKTGTTNEGRDAWFIGFTPDLAVGLYIGFDQPRSLGNRETGSSVAVPAFKHVMERVLAATPDKPFKTPPGVVLVRVDPKTGARVGRGQGGVLEAFLPGTVPTGRATTVLDGSVEGWGAGSVSGGAGTPSAGRPSGSGGGASSTLSFGTGGLY